MRFAVIAFFIELPWLKLLNVNINVIIITQ